MVTAWKWDPSFLPKNGGAMYGWFFFMWIGIMAIEGVLLLPSAAKRNGKTTDRVVLVYGLIMLAAEIYKQIFFTVETGEYPWNLFQWQFCSTPMFAAVTAPLLKNGRVKDAIYRFLAFFGLIAGIMTIIIPEGFYWDYVTITCHSFFWHTSIVIIGLYLIIAKGSRSRSKTSFANGSGRRPFTRRRSGLRSYSTRFGGFGSRTRLGPSRPSTCSISRLSTTARCPYSATSSPMCPTPCSYSFTYSRSASGLRRYGFAHTESG